ncbi:ATP-binding protein [Iningainema tapete]|uniref:histidine kinase n=1 Tax=Iningainema tapete BLCC-T55 TaxID=2748662 RepID=A0A8J6XL42_9CYAN|nr:HAMP domain-containing protein [Iningainema tapete BLCC-T55]
MNQISSIFRKIDLFSLRVRLTIGVAVVSALGLGSLAILTSWRTQQLLIDSHKQSIEQIAARLPRDLEVYSEMSSPQVALQKTIINLTTSDTLLWVKNPNQKIIAKSTNLIPSDSTVAQLLALTEMPINSQVYKVNQRYFVVRGGSLQVQGKALGKLFVVQDITRDQTMFLALMQSLSVASIVVIILMAVAIALYIQRSLQPLRQLSQMTELISAEDLGEARLYLSNAPSEVKELAQTLNMMLTRLSQSWEKERQFVSNVSHELRTPLTIIQGYLQSVLRRQQHLTQVQREALETAALEAERTIHILQDLLDLVRADSGYLHFNIESCMLNDLVAEVAEMARQYSDRTITIESSQPIEVKADYNRTKQILLNLIDNAIKYSDPNTPIILKLEQREEQGIIQVCDRGYGIPLQHQSRIFERFYRVDEARNRSTGGSGLGLSIVKTFVEAMGGSVTVRSRIGEGSVFIVTLPA